MKKEKKLLLTRETVRKLTKKELVRANGGVPPSVVGPIPSLASGLTA